MGQQVCSWSPNREGFWEEELQKSDIHFNRENIHGNTAAPNALFFFLDDRSIKIKLFKCFDSLGLLSLCAGINIHDHVEPQDPKHLRGGEKRGNSAILGMNSINSECHETGDGQFVLQLVCCCVFGICLFSLELNAGNAHSLCMHTCSRWITSLGPNMGKSAAIFKPRNHIYFA